MGTSSGLCLNLLVWPREMLYQPLTSWGNQFSFAQFPSKHFSPGAGETGEQSHFPKAFRLFEQRVLLPVLLPRCSLLSHLAGVKLYLLKISCALKYTLGLWCAWWNISWDHLKVLQSLTAAALHPASAERRDECGSQGERNRITESLFPFFHSYSWYIQYIVSQLSSVWLMDVLI